MRQYRRTNLLASWLVAGFHPAADRPSSPLLYVLNQEPIVRPTLEDFSRRLGPVDVDLAATP